MQERGTSRVGEECHHLGGPAGARGVEARASARVGEADEGAAASIKQGLCYAGAAQGGRLVQAGRPAAWRGCLEHLLCGPVTKEVMTYVHMATVDGDIER